VKKTPLLREILLISRAVQAYRFSPSRTTILIAHTGEVGMNSDYFFAYYLPVATAALYCGSWMTMLWTLFASAAYCSYLYPIARYEAMSKDLRHLALQIMSLFLVAIVVHRFFRFKHSRNIPSRNAV
jgi:hypothetical protein